ncbi:MAG: 30S ribosomal protein S16 [Cytophagales bacterium]|nr:30S ribosomal protein S16 [Cytophagales bacterium]
MAVMIRLARRGRKRLARYDVVVTDARSPRDGKFIEKIGTYDPLTVPATIKLDEDKAFSWLMKGAQPSDTVKAMLSYRGVMLKRHLQIGVVKGALTQEQADAKLAEWKTKKEENIQSKIDTVSKTKQDVAKARKEAETKVREARTEAIRKKAEAAVAAAEAPVAEAPAEETAVAEATEATEAAATEAPAAEVPAPEVPASEAPATDSPAPEAQA